MCKRPKAPPPPPPPAPPPPPPAQQQMAAQMASPEDEQETSEQAKVRRKLKGRDSLRIDASGAGAPAASGVNIPRG